MLEECLRADVERVVYTSSIAAIGAAARGSTVDETSTFSGSHGIPYVAAKREAEVEALRVAARGLPLVIVNPGHVFGAGDLYRSSTDVVRRFLRRQIPAYVDGGINIVDVADVASGHLLADEKGVVGERYVLGNRNYTWDRLFADIGRISGVEPPAVKLPLPAALAFARAAEAAPGTASITTTEVRAASLWWTCRNTKAKRELGWKPAPHEDTVEATVEWYRDREGDHLSRSGARQPIGLRVAGFAVQAGRRRRREVHRLMATLYRCRTPTDWLCPCGRVARSLKKHGVEHDQVRVPFRKADREEVDALTGQRHVPVLVARRGDDLRLAPDRRAPRVAGGRRSGRRGAARASVSGSRSRSGRRGASVGGARREQRRVHRARPRRRGGRSAA